MFLHLSVSLFVNKKKSKIIKYVIHLRTNLSFFFIFCNNLRTLELYGAAGGRFIFSSPVHNSTNERHKFRNR